MRSCNSEHNTAIRRKQLVYDVISHHNHNKYRILKNNDVHRFPPKTESETSINRSQSHSRTPSKCVTAIQPKRQRLYPPHLLTMRNLFAMILHLHHQHKDETAHQQWGSLVATSTTRRTTTHRDPGTTPTPASRLFAPRSRSVHAMIQGRLCTISSSNHPRMFELVSETVRLNRSSIHRNLFPWSACRSLGRLR